MRSLFAIVVGGILTANAFAQAKHVNPNVTPGVNGTPGTAVVLPRYYGAYGGYYNYNYFNYNAAFMNANGYYPGFGQQTMPTGQFYMMMGGPAPSNPFAGNINALTGGSNFATNSNLPGYTQNSVLPFGYYNFTNIPQNPMLNFAPVVGQSNGYFAAPQMPLPPQNPTGFGVQGINAFGNQKKQ